jgi:hypothetical protein
MEGMTDDALHAPGNGADRLSARDGAPLQVVVRAANACDGNQAPGPIEQLSVASLQDELQAWRWAKLSFQAAGDDRAVFRHDARVSTGPWTKRGSCAVIRRPAIPIEAGFGGSCASRSASSRARGHARGRHATLSGEG